MPTFPEPEDDTIVVTGRLGRTDPEIGGFTLSRWLEWAVYVPRNAPDPLTEEGGNELPQVATLEMIDGDLIVRLPSYSFEIKVLAEDWARMGAAERAGFIKMMTEFKDSPMFVQTLDNLQAQNPGSVVIRYSSQIHSANGAPAVDFPQNQVGNLSTVPDPSDPSRIAAGSAVVISITSSLLPNNGIYPMERMPDGSLVQITLPWVIAHELRHTFYAGMLEPLHGERWIV